MVEVVIDPLFVINVVLVFLVSLIGVYVCFWVRRLNSKMSAGLGGDGLDGSGRLEYYEKQFIDMKIRLDMLESMQNHKTSDIEGDITPKHVARLEQMLADVLKEREKANGQEVVREKSTVIREESVPAVRLPAYPNPVDYILQLITDGITTSHDIQITMKKSREHTARLLKKMYEDGLLQRSDGTRPYTYSVTPKGKERLQKAASV